jgi:hypothetical protein
MGAASLRAEFIDELYAATPQQPSDGIWWCTNPEDREQRFYREKMLRFGFSYEQFGQTQRLTGSTNDLERYYKAELAALERISARSSAEEARMVLLRAELA